MTKIESNYIELLKIPHKSKFYADSESEIRFSKKNVKKSKKIAKTK